MKEGLTTDKDALCDDDDDDGAIPPSWYNFPLSTSAFFQRFPLSGVRYRDSKLFCTFFFQRQSFVTLTNRPVNKLMHLLIFQYKSKNI